MDYPFNLKGILYFPKINTEYDSIEGTIKLYNNQVFIADNIKEVIPEFLMLLKGVIDCPDLPLNVSRSALQNDGFVKKISEYISKKVADKLSGMCKTERESYEKYWDDIAPFIKFGCLKDEKFASKMNDYILFKNIENKYNTLANYYTKEEKKENEDVKETKIYYVSDEKAQATYINMFKENGKDAVILTHNIDTPFISNLEMKNEGLHFYRIDADVSEEAKTEISKENEEVYEDLKKKVSEVLKDEKVEISIVELKDEKIASMITISEEARRMEEMMKQYGMMGLDPSMFGGNTPKTLVLNANSAIVKALISSEGEKFTLLAEQLFDMALLNHASLEGDRLAKFIARTSELMLKLS